MHVRKLIWGEEQRGVGGGGGGLEVCLHQETTVVQGQKHADVQINVGPFGRRLGLFRACCVSLPTYPVCANS